ncbi:hypothetical protein GTCCBUS3UF5_19340 [Geobacillus thermoleovorans CCB_US3_UF5]|uniref:Uncharacterized protein n=1 Tax=Geobacillus thermoleovorans CCB_US3_UF5 TaxID=1111068 RepID=A0ABM5MI56_GEOTH|nr:hypothetical protein GTCCBUS3UF5_19340 [Geobacillus thermoleovorans CCB_US3_UF5]
MGRSSITVANLAEKSAGMTIVAKLFHFDPLPFKSIMLLLV